MALGHGNENSNDDGTRGRGHEYSLDEDGVLDLPEGGFLDPDLAVEDLAHDVAGAVLRHPRLVLERVCARAVERLADAAAAALALELALVVRREQLPRPHVLVVQAVQHDAHALPRGDERCEAQDR